MTINWTLWLWQSSFFPFSRIVIVLIMANWSTMCTQQLACSESPSFLWSAGDQSKGFVDVRQVNYFWAVTLSLLSFLTRTIMELRLGPNVPAFLYFLCAGILGMIGNVTPCWYPLISNLAANNWFAVRSRVSYLW